MIMLYFMNRSIDAFALGGTLFVPAIHKHLEPIAHGEKFTDLRSVVFDTEDGLKVDALDEGLARIERLLAQLQPVGLLRFIRPRNVKVLHQILAFKHIECIDGFILPKFGLGSAEDYLRTIDSASFTPLFMPSIEGEELFDAMALKEIRTLLLPYKARIPLIRFGAEDMLRQLALRRDCAISLYEMAATSQVIASMIGTFKPYGFDISAPVFPCYKDKDRFEYELLRDLREGLVSKTIIHPDQISALDKLYRVSKKEFEHAEQIIDSTEAVFAQEGKMAERSTNHPWAEQIIIRVRLYGLR